MSKQSRIRDSTNHKLAEMSAQMFALKSMETNVFGHKNISPRVATLETKSSRRNQNEFQFNIFFTSLTIFLVSRPLRGEA